MDLIDLGRILAGLVLLVLGGEALVRGASALASRVGISSLVVGLTVVSAATSAPELAVTVGAVLGGEPGLAVGNVVGSNIANVLLILGVSALILPLIVQAQLVRIDVPFMVLLSLALLLFSLDGRISTLDGALLLGAVVAHTVLTIVVSRRQGAAVAAHRALDTADDPSPPPVAITKSALFVAGGVGLLVIGAQLLVGGAVNIAADLGVSSLVVGLTIVAVGTSLPELATSVIAVRRGERDLAVGNVVGSNIFNIGAVLGLPALLVTGGIPVPAAAVAFDLPLMLAAAIALVPIAFTGFTVARWEGGLFVLLYAGYVAFVVLAATEHDALAGFTSIMAWFVLPLIALTLVLFTTFELGMRKGQRDARRAAEP